MTYVIKNTNNSIIKYALAIFGAMISAFICLPYSKDGEAYKYIYQNILEITELPLGSWTDNYKEFLDELMTKNNLIKNYKNNSNKDNVKFAILINNSNDLTKMDMGAYYWCI